MNWKHDAIYIFRDFEKKSYVDLFLFRSKKILKFMQKLYYDLHKLGMVWESLFDPIRHTGILLLIVNNQK